MSASKYQNSEFVDFFKRNYEESLDYTNQLISYKEYEKIQIRKRKENGAEIDSETIGWIESEYKDFVEYHKVLKYNKKQIELRQSQLYPYERSNHNIELPGRREITRENCGTIKDIISCKKREHLNKGFYKILRSYCYQAGCPICYPAWAKREGIEVERTFQKFNEFLKNENIVGKKYYGLEKHFVISVENAKDFLELQGLTAFRSFGIQTAKEFGIKGGCIVVHSHRQKCFECGGHDELYHDEDHKCSCEEPSWYYYISPHYHIMGYGFVPEQQQGTTTVIVNLGWRENIQKTISYELSHCANEYKIVKRHKRRTPEQIKNGIKKEQMETYEVEQLTKTLTYFGFMSGRTIAKEKQKIQEPITCPGCENEDKEGYYHHLEGKYTLKHKSIGNRLIQDRDYLKPYINKLYCKSKDIELESYYFRCKQNIKGAEIRDETLYWELDVGNIYFRQVNNYIFKFKDVKRKIKYQRDDIRNQNQNNCYFRLKKGYIFTQDAEKIEIKENDIRYQALNCYYYKIIKTKEKVKEEIKEFFDDIFIKLKNQKKLKKKENDC